MRLRNAMKTPIALSLTIVITTLLAAPSALACINGYEGSVNDLKHGGNPQQIAAALSQLEMAYKDAPSATVANDLGVVLMLSGNPQRAIDVLTQLEHDSPGLSRTASNLGTALELAGRNAEALEWIEQGIVRDPRDHDGTEWLHVKILQAKIALAQDPTWLQTHTVMWVSLGTQTAPQPPVQGLTDHRGSPISLAQAQQAIAYQLQERLHFVKPPDPAVWDTRRSFAPTAHALCGTTSSR